ncbi:MAG TPA: PHB depolymerase family esterase [Mycobacteriales bacterium]|nr:PHB depolymerase family esterase [Mycobacteriales bacterium]
MRRAAALLLITAAAACSSSPPAVVPPVGSTAARISPPSSTAAPSPIAAAPPTSEKPRATPTPTPTPAATGLVDVAALAPALAAPPRTSTVACNAPAPPKAVHLTVDGYARTALTVAPTGHVRVPLVIALHGYDQQASYFADYTHLLTAGPHVGAMVVVPQGLGDPSGWNIPDSPEVGPSDVRFLTALITRLVQTTCADPDRVVLAGLSDGSDMAVTAACALPDLVDGVLLVAASTGPSPSCHPQHVVQIHGTADPIDAYTGRPKDLRRGFGSVKAAGAERAFTLWSQLDGCPSHVVRTQRDLRAFVAQHCAHGSVLLIAVQGGGHTWPGAPLRPELGPTTTSLDTAQLLDLVLAAISLSPR